MSGIFAQITRMLPLNTNRQAGNDGMQSFSDTRGWFFYHQQDVIENWWFYNGFHNRFLRQMEAEQDKDFVQRQYWATIENQIKPILNLVVAHLYGSEPTRYVERNGEADKELNDFFEQTVWDITANKEVDGDKALNTVVTGYTIIQRHLYDVRTDKPFVGFDKIEMSKYAYIKKEPLDSAFSVPLPYVDENGMVQPRRLGAILTIAEHDNLAGNADVMKLLQRPITKQTVIEYVDDTNWLKWVRVGNNSDWTQVTVNPGSQYENKNQFGRVDIPFTLYRNTGEPFYLEGESDIRDLKTMNMELNELANGDKDAIKQNQYPILCIFGGNLPKDFIRTKDAALEFESKDAKADFLTWDSKLEASGNRQDTIRRNMSTVSGISLLGRGFMKDIGQIRSGPPLKALFTSDRAVMSRKFAVFGACEVQDMKSDLLFYSAYTGKDFKIDKTVEFCCEFDEDFLGIDELLNAEVKALEVQSGTIDIQTVLEEEHPEWTKEEINKAVENIKKAKETKQAVGQPRQSSDKKASQQKPKQ